MNNAAQQFRAQFENNSEAIEFENSVLSVGSEFLPACAIAVRDGEGGATDGYYQFLISQIED